jgi:uncharacterized phage-associated protein
MSFEKNGRNLGLARIKAWLQTILNKSQASTARKHDYLPYIGGMTTSTTAIDAAQFICERGSWKVTNLALQKILYLIQMVYMGEHDGGLAFSANFQAWDYGPVEPNIYRMASMFGNEPVQNVFKFRGAKEVTDKDVLASLEEGCDFLLKKTPGQLVNMTHWKDGAWAQHYVPGAKNVTIPNADILKEYRRRIDGQRSTKDREII